MKKFIMKLEYIVAVLNHLNKMYHKGIYNYADYLHYCNLVYEIDILNEGEIFNSFKIKGEILTPFLKIKNNDIKRYNYLHSKFIDLKQKFDIVLKDSLKNICIPNKENHLKKPFSTGNTLSFYGIKNVFLCELIEYLENDIKPIFCNNQ